MGLIDPLGWLHDGERTQESAELASTSFRVGLGVSAGSLLLLLGIPVGARIWRRRRSADAGQA